MESQNKRSLLTILLPAFVFLALFVALIILGIKVNELEDRSNTSPVTNRYTTHNHAEITIARSQIVYVPIYSHINTSDGEKRLLEATLSIRNSDPEQKINLVSARYYNTDGHQLEDYIEQPTTLGPLQTKEFLIKKMDTRGGSGANFIVEWVADNPVYEPIIEAIMISNQGISFKSPGRPLSQRTKK